MLRLDATRAREILGWTPLLDFDAMIEWTAAWYRGFLDEADMRGLTMTQVDAFLGKRVRLTLPTKRDVKNALQPKSLKK